MHARVVNTATVVLHDDDGQPVVDGRLWARAATDVDVRVLEHAGAPVLDIGCGPARHALALAEQGRVALGIDITDAAVSHARARRVPVLRRGVFDPVPAAGRWGSALLLDGNVGIGGDPVALLRRARELVRAGGTVLVETAPPRTYRPTVTAHLVIDGRRGPRFRWAHVAADDLQALAGRARLVLAEQWCDTGRWFGRLVRV
jgi:SAM-dependent methyltransferase